MGHTKAWKGACGNWSYIKILGRVVRGVRRSNKVRSPVFTLVDPLKVAIAAGAFVERKSWRSPCIERVYHLTIQ